jgi:hypothetical protein
MNNPMPSKSARATHFMRGVVREMILLLVVFLLGFVPMWLKARDAASRLSEAERHLNLASAQNALAAAAIETH